MEFFCVGDFQRGEFSLGRNNFTQGLSRSLYAEYFLLVIFSLRILKFTSVEDVPGNCPGGIFSGNGNTGRIFPWEDIFHGRNFCWRVFHRRNFPLRKTFRRKQWGLRYDIKKDQNLNKKQVFSMKAREFFRESFQRG